MGNKIEYSPRALDVALEVDVAVCGGGPAGVAAAVAASRSGASVALLEAGGCLGGLGTAGLIPCFNPFTDREKPVVRGIGEEVLKGLAARMGVAVEYDWMPINAEHLKLVYDCLLARTTTELRLFTKAIDVVAHDGAIEALVVSTHGGPRAVTARVFIDATGDGDVAAWAGAPTVTGDASGAMQGASLCLTVAGVDWDEFRANLAADGERPDRILWEKQAAEGKTPLAEPRLAVGILPTGAGIGQSNAGHVFNVNGLDEKSLTAGITAGRVNAGKLMEWYRANVPGFAHGELAASAPLLGIRETRRIVGEYVLSREDYAARASFDDEVGRNANPIDVHASSPDTQCLEAACNLEMQSQYAPGESYAVPYRCLIPKRVENLLVAGRCVSTDRQMNGSMRVMPACFVTGQAAGVAAGLAAANSHGAVRQIDTRRLKEILIAQGAWIP